MTILNVFLWGGVAFAVLLPAMVLARRFDRHCLRRFRHEFFTRAGFGATVVIVALLMVGQYWHDGTIHHHGHALNGLVPMAMAALVFCALLWMNVRRTNLPYGVGGTVAQVGIMLIPAEIFLFMTVLVVVVIVLRFLPRR